MQNHGFGDVAIKTSGSGWATWMENQLEEGVLFFNYRGYLGMSGFNTVMWMMQVMDGNYHLQRYSRVEQVHLQKIRPACQKNF